MKVIIRDELWLYHAEGEWTLEYPAAFARTRDGQTRGAAGVVSQPPTMVLHPGDLVEVSL